MKNFRYRLLKALASIDLPDWMPTWVKEEPEIQKANEERNKISEIVAMNKIYKKENNIRWEYLEPYKYLVIIANKKVYVKDTHITKRCNIITTIDEFFFSSS